MSDFKVVELSVGSKKVCFSIEPPNGVGKIDRQNVNDIVEDAIIEAKSSSDDIYDVGDQVAFSLGDAGYIVRDIPAKYERLEFDIEKYKVESNLLDAPER